VNPRVSFIIEFRRRMSQKGPFLRHPADSLIVPVPEASHVVSKLILESKYQNLTNAMNFDTIVVYETDH
jgi:hypothetical protein